MCFVLPFFTRIEQDGMEWHCVNNLLNVDESIFAEDSMAAQ